MTPLDDESLPSIGYDLLSHAQEFGEPNRLPITTQLFPFLFLASRRMTTREMSEWLDKNKGVKLSAVMISKGLKRPDLHLRRIAEHVQPLAAYVTAVYHYSGETAESLLFGKDEESGESALKAFADMVWNDPDSPSEGVTEALETLAELWEPMPEEVKFMCLRYLDFSDDASDDSTNNQA